MLDAGGLEEVIVETGLARASTRVVVAVTARGNVGTRVAAWCNMNPMIRAKFIVNGEERETREVERKWLQDVWTEHDNVLLNDGNPYQIVDITFTDTDALVQLEAPRVAPGG